MDKTYIFAAGSKFSLAKVNRTLAPGYTLSINEHSCYQSELLDTFDGELIKNSKLLFQNEYGLQLIDIMSGKIISQSGKAAGLCRDEIEPGPVQSNIGPISKLRALIPGTTVELAIETASMLDDEQKTVARLQCYQFNHRKGAATLLITRSLRGYNEEFEALSKIIEAHGGTAATSLASALKINISDYNPKPDVALDPAAPIYQSAKAIIATFINVARQNEPGIIADIDTEFLHDYRVSLRKVRSVISLFKGVYSPDETDRLKNEFADLMQITGRLRDLDVYLLERSYYYSLVPPSTHEGIDIMFETFMEERTQLHKHIKKSLKNKDYKKRIDKLSTQCIEGKWEKGDTWQQSTLAFGSAAILKRYNKVCRIARTIDETTPDDVVHELRIHCKKLRYLMEFFTPLFDKKQIKTLIKSLKILQDNLGNFNDFSVQQESLAAFLDTFSHTSKKSIKVAEGIGGLIAMLNHLQKEEKGKVMDNFALFDSEETKTLFHDLFSTGNSQ